MRSFARLSLFAAPALVALACSHEKSDGGSPWPTADVNLVTDDMGITHVLAESDADAFFGAGYAMARDRLLQMEFFRRRALGRTAELLGPHALTGDIGARAFDFKRLGEQDDARVKAERPADARLVDAWVAGVNARIAEVASGAAPRPYGMRPTELDFVPERWRSADANAIGKLLAFGLSNSLDSEILATALLRLAPDLSSRMPLSLPAYDTFTVAPAGSSTGGIATPPKLAGGGTVPPGIIPALSFADFGGGHSNNWAVDAAHSSNGRPLLAGDPHQPLSSPSRFWPVHMQSTGGGGSFDVVGFAFVGTPAVELGHNAHIGWTATTNFADVMDLWDVTTDPDRTVVHLANGDHAVVSRKEKIRVKTGAGYEENEVVLEDVPGYGILLPDAILPLPHSFLAEGNAILFGWTGFRPTREILAYLDIDRAKSVDEFDAAADLLDVGAVNFVSADAQHIDYHVHSIIPDRGAPSSHAMPWRILPGSDAASLWTGATLGPDKLPHLRDPARGFIITANNDPWGFTQDGNVENDPFYYGAFYSNGMRAHRIEDAMNTLLANGAKATRADMEALQNDTHSPMADTILPKLADAISAIGADASLDAYRARDDLRALGSALAAWDRRFERSSGAAAVFVALEWLIAKRVFGKALPGSLLDAINAKSPPYMLGQLRNVLEDRFAAAASFVPPGGKRALLLAALDDTAQWLVARFGTIDTTRFKYADVNFARFASANGGDSDPPPVAVDGSCDTVKVDEVTFLGPSAAPLDKMMANEVSLYRMAISFADDGVPEATLDFARGAREEPSDPHFGDMETPWVDGKHLPLAFRPAEIAARATETKVLKRR